MAEWTVIRTPDKSGYRYKVGSFTSDVIQPDQEANAHVLAAAHDLLDACKFALQYLEANPDECSNPRAKACGEAIGKALFY